MSNSPTDGAPQTPASNEPTGQQPVVPQSAEPNNQEANPQPQQGNAPENTAQENQNQQNGEGEQKQTPQQGSDSPTDDGLANFAKSQNIDLENASDDVKRLLKVALDNQKAARSNTPSKSISDATEELGDGSVQAEVAQLKYERTTDKFWGQDGRDKSLEPAMVEILNEKKEQYGKEYAFNLSRDLDTLYGLAQIKSGAKNSNVDIEAIRREERESINRQMSAGAPQAHATQGGQPKTVTVTEDWIRDEYDPRNPEHITMMQDAGLR